MSKPAVEEALEKLYLRDVENRALSPDDMADTALAEAQAEGLIGPAAAPDIFRLTDSGRRLGEDVVRRHRLAECLLRDVLAESAEALDDEACQFEHILQPGLTEKICVLLGHPAACPHGKAIPAGPCCLKARQDTIREVRPLCDAVPGSKGVVAYLMTRDNRQVQKMMALGVLPGTPIRVIQCFPSYVFQIGYSQFAVDRALAAIIVVHWE